LELGHKQASWYYVLSNSLLLKKKNFKMCAPLNLLKLIAADA
jgi:hypothetical protein